MARIFKASLRVRFSELDPYGHVHHAEYLKYLEWARMEYLRQAGMTFAGLMDRGIYVVVVHADIDFTSPAVYDEELVITGYIEEVGTTSLTMVQRIEEKNTKRKIVEARFTFVFLDRERQKIPVPEDLIRLLL